MNSKSKSPPIDLLELYKFPAVNNLSEFCQVTSQLDVAQLVMGYHSLRNSAPHRHARNKRYFVGHDGMPLSSKRSNRREEHLAIALWNQAENGSALLMPDGRELRFVDYQFPLKAQQADGGVGKVDLFAITSKGEACVVELKIHGLEKRQADTPLRAYLEALAYCAIVSANIEDVGKEALSRFEIKLSEKRIVLVVLAPEEYWAHYLSHHRTGEWLPKLRSLAKELDEALGIESHLLALRNVNLRMGLANEKPQLENDCTIIALDDLDKERKGLDQSHESAFDE